MITLEELLKMRNDQVVEHFGGKPMSASKNLRTDLDHGFSSLSDGLPDKDNFYLYDRNADDRRILYVVAGGREVNPGELDAHHFGVVYHPENVPKAEQIERFNLQ